MNAKREHAIELLAEHVVVRGHADVYEVRQRTVEGEAKPIEESWLPRLSAANVDFVVLAVSGDSVPHRNGDLRSCHAALDNLDCILNELEYSDRLVHVKKTSDIPDRPDGRTRFLLSLEGGSPFEGSLGILRHFYRLGIRLLQPTHNVRNELADGGHEERTGGGLSRFGVQAIQECNRLGIVVDVAHLTSAGFRDVVELSTKPVVVSHGNCKAIYPHKRNLDDDQIRAIAKTGGVVGMLCLPDYANEGLCRMPELIRHAAHVIELVGVDHLSIGHLGLDAPLCDVFRNIYAGPYKGYAEFTRDDLHGGVDEAEQFIAFVEGLIGLGLSDSEVVKVLSGNFRRVLAETFAER